MEIPVITPGELVNLAIHGKPFALIDVRTPAEFRDMHVAFAHNIPLDKLDPQAIMQGRNGESAEPLYMICRSGGRGQKACELFHAAGFSNVVNVAGGTLGCEEAGMPIVRGKKTMPVDRQAQIAAGVIVLFGALLTTTVNPWFIFVPAIVGAIQIVAGLTGRNAIAALLAKTPWNRCSGCAIADFCCTGSSSEHAASHADADCSHA